MIYLVYDSIYQEEFQASIFFLNIKIFLLTANSKKPTPKAFTGVSFSA